MNVRKAGVVGAGAMGCGIAQVLSQAGIEVVLKDIEPSFVERGLANIKRMYDSRVKKGALSQDEADKLLKTISGTTSFDGFKDVDLVVEAALEQIEVKLDIFSTLDSVCPARTILASNTSALSISEIASATKRADKVLGMHFFNPAQAMKLVEVIPGVHTSSETVQTALDLCKDLGKSGVRVRECPGFLVNRVLFPYMNETLYALQEGAASMAEIDAAVVAFGMPMGPLTLLDMTGIDICGHVNEFLYSEYGPRFATAPILKAMVKAGQLGQKSGAGFYLHEKGAPAKKDEPKKANPKVDDLLKEIGCDAQKGSQPFDVYRVILPMFNEAVYALEEQVVVASDVDVAMKNGCGMQRGLFSIAEEKGLPWCLNQLEQYQEKHGERFRPAWLLRQLVRAGVHDFSKLGRAPVTAR